VADLVAYAGANERTVRSVMKRDHALFHRTSPAQDDERTRALGRPPLTWRVRDMTALRQELLAMEEAIGLLRSGVEPSLEQSRDMRDVSDAVEEAEHSLVEAWEEPDPEIRRSRLRAAEIAVAPVLRMESLDHVVSHASGSDDAEAFARRARMVDLMARLGDQERHSMTAQVDALLEACSEGLVRTEDVLSTGVAANYLRRIFDAGQTRFDLPPVRFVGSPVTHPADYFAELATTNWVRTSTAGLNATLWNQKWARPLADRGLTVCVILDAGVERGMFSEARELLAAAPNISVLCVSDNADSRFMADLSEAGVVYVPRASGYAGLLRSMKSVTQRFLRMPMGTLGLDYLRALDPSSSPEVSAAVSWDRSHSHIRAIAHRGIRRDSAMPLEGRQKGRLTGRIVWIDPDTGWGFLQTDEGPQVLIRLADGVEKQPPSSRSNQRVELELSEGRVEHIRSAL
jgi:cold shock CspA family protein